MRAKIIIAVISALLLGGMSFAFGQTRSGVVHEGSGKGKPAGCYDAAGRPRAC
jgi:hypothetical protein